VVIYVSERRYPQHVSRVAAALCGPFYFYPFGAGAWYLFGVKYAAGVFVLGLLVTVVLVWKDAFRVRAEEIDWWGRPRDPMDTRTTSPF
jgi:hypothetical protein